MTDGPFKNAALSSRWKRYGDALINDAMSSNERTERVHSAILKDLCTKESRALITELDTYVKRLQKDLLPREAVNAIFDKHPKTPQADILQKFLSANLARPMGVESAWHFAFDSFVKHEAYGTENRMVEQCMSARDRGDLPNYSKAVERNHEAFAGLNHGRIRDDLLSGKSASKFAIAKHSSIDDGPE